MTILALSLVLLAALTHASWNIYAKFAAESRHFVWLFSTGSVLIYGPVVIAVLIVERPVFEARHWLALAATSVLHLLYSLSLQTGYRHSDFSVVYPIARGTGPLLSFIGAGLLLGEALDGAVRCRLAADRRWHPAGRGDRRASPPCAWRRRVLRAAHRRADRSLHTQ